jgi:uncharacterized protein
MPKTESAFRHFDLADESGHRGFGSAELAICRTFAGPASSGRRHGLKARHCKSRSMPLLKSRHLRLHLLALMVLLRGATLAQSVPPALFTDPQPDPAFPAGMKALRIPSHGKRINGIIYIASGQGPHPTLVLFHGLPGNEKNLDIAQAVRRAGWNAVAFSYRGSWGSPGKFSFSHNLEDARSVLKFLREPVNAKQLRIDTSRIVVAGHSMGGWVAIETAAHDHDLIGVILISAADLPKQGKLPREQLVALMAGCMGPLAGATPKSMADEARALGGPFEFESSAPNLTQVPLLALTADDGLAGYTDALVQAIRADGGHQITTMHAATDHNWSDHRIALQSIILRWLRDR